MSQLYLQFPILVSQHLNLFPPLGCWRGIIHIKLFRIHRSKQRRMCFICLLRWNISRWRWTHFIIRVIELREQSLLNHVICILRRKRTTLFLHIFVCNINLTHSLSIGLMILRFYMLLNIWFFCHFIILHTHPAVNTATSFVENLVHHYYFYLFNYKKLN